MSSVAQDKQRTNVSLTARTLSAARRLGLNVSAISDAALAAAVKEAEAAEWAERNAAAIAERKAWIDANGTPLGDVQSLDLD